MTLILLKTQLYSKTKQDSSVKTRNYALRKAIWFLKSKVVIKIFFFSIFSFSFSAKNDTITNNRDNNNNNNNDDDDNNKE